LALRFLIACLLEDSIRRLVALDVRWCNMRIENNIYTTKLQITNANNKYFDPAIN